MAIRLIGLKPFGKDERLPKRFRVGIESIDKAVRYMKGDSLRRRVTIQNGHI